ncbi:hypothetical protein [Enterococcus sp.]|uniref:hypothetical protein n=1 Tax=Enterococcus sp. TaxID=35783 RepID=UPI00289DFE6C|nr:hypothetical protein [Enterococcus sp.]
MKKMDHDGHILSIIIKGYSLLYLFYFACIRFLFSTITNLTVSLVDRPGDAAAGNGFFYYLFNPILLIICIIGIALLAWRDKSWLKELVYPTIVLLLVCGSVYIL